MAGEVLFAAEKLFDIICEAKERWGQRKQNTPLAEELQRFMQDLRKNAQELQNKAAGTLSNSSACALAALGDDLESAVGDAKDILNQGFIRSIWDARTTLSKIQALHQRVMTSFQTRILFTTLDVPIEGQKGMDAFKTAMLKVNENLHGSTNSDSIKDALRSELKHALQPIMVAMESEKDKIKVARLMVHSTDAQTTDTEKFLADVLAELEQISIGSSSEEAISEEAIAEWLEDPITRELMCDPVKAVDGHTYDRWTIVEHAGLDTFHSPFAPCQAFAIATDDIDVRSHLFAKFPEQEVKFHTKRAEYRERALEEARMNHLRDAVSMLGHVLQWDPDDKECGEKREQALLEMEVERASSRQDSLYKLESGFVKGGTS